MNHTRYLNIIVVRIKIAERDNGSSNNNNSNNQNRIGLRRNMINRRNTRNTYACQLLSLLASKNVSAPSISCNESIRGDINGDNNDLQTIYI